MEEEVTKVERDTPRCDLVWLNLYRITDLEAFHLNYAVSYGPSGPERHFVLNSLSEALTCFTS